MEQKIDLTEDELLQRLDWFINIRWLFIVFIVTAVLTAINVFKLILPVVPIALITLFIAGYNAGFKVYLKSKIIRLKQTDNARRFAILQSMLDIISLTALIHFSGGAENPFIFYFIFHTILTGMLLSKRESYFQAGATCLIVVGLFVLEYLNIVPHYSVKEFLSVHLYKNSTYIFAVSFVFVSTIFIATFFTVSVSEKMKEANLKLLEKDRRKDEYVKMVSHDLKSPLASIQSLLDVIIGEFAGPVDEKIKEVLQRIRKKTEFLHHYTKDLLDLSRIRAEKNLNLQRFKIKEVIDAAAEIALPKMEEKDIRFNVEIDELLPDIEADKEMITYVFLNLLANAFKYTASGGKVWVKVSQENGSIVTEIRDTGIGIPRDDIPHIFEEFFRAANVANTTRGTGLGLALAKYIVERHGGKISLESEVGKGTSFQFTIPMQAAAAQ